MMKDKACLRKEYKKIRGEIDRRNRDEQERILYKKFFAADEYKKAKVIFIYVSCGSEVNTKRIINKIIDDGKTVAVPKCDVKSKSMRALIIKDISQLENGVYEIEEPRDGCKEVSKSDIDLAVVPGLCFDLRGNRLGYGGGYYDRFLAGFNGTSIAFAFRECIADEVPAERYDCKVDLIIVPDEVV